MTPAGDVPSARARFARAIGPCLALTAPAGMSEDDRMVWVDAAYGALRHLPIDLIERGAEAAKRIADHPSKIVPAIIDATLSDLAWRRRMSDGRPAQEALPAPGGRCTGKEAAEIIQRFGLDRGAADPSRPAEIRGGSDRPGRKPTREDYLRMGVTPDVLDRIEVEVTE